MSYKILILIILFEKCISFFNIVFQNEQISVTSLSECIVQAGKKFLNESDTISISLSDTEPGIIFENILLTNLFNINFWTIMIMHTKIFDQNVLLLKQIDCYILHIENLQELEWKLETLQKYDSWNPRAKFIINTVVSWSNSKQLIVTKIFKILWFFHIIHSIILLPSKLNNSLYEAYSWFPYSNDNCGNKFDKILIVSRCSFGIFFNYSNWFPNKIPNNLHNCPMRVTTNVRVPFVMKPIIDDLNECQYNTGLHVFLLETISQVANFKIVYSCPEDDVGNVFSNGTATGLFLNLIEKKAEFALGQVVALPARIQIFDVVISCFHESLVWCVPHATEEKPWERLMTIISIKLCFYLCLIYTLLTLIIWIYGKFKVDYKSYRILGRCIQNMFAIMIGVPVKILPQTFSIRITLLLWILFSLLLNITFQSLYTSTLTNKKYTKQIDKFSDLLNSNLIIQLRSNALEHFNSSTEEDILVRKKIHVCKHLEICLEKVAYERDAAIGVPVNYVNYVKQFYFNSEMQPLIYCFKESIVDIPMVIPMRKGFPIRERIADIVGRITSAGFFKIWRKKIYGKVDESRPTKNKKILSLKHFKVIFVILLLGELLSFIVFIMEIIIQ